MKKSDSQFKSYGSGILLAVLLGFSFITAKIMSEKGGVLEAMTWRYDIAMIFVALLIAFRVIKVRFKFSILKNAVPSACCYMGFMILQAWGLEYSTSIESGIASALIPIIATILSAVFLHERANVTQIILLMVSLCALIVMIVLGTKIDSVSLFGSILLLLASVSMAGSNISMRFFRKHLNTVETPVVIIFVGFVAFNLASIADWIATGNAKSFIVLATDPIYLLSAAYLSIFCIFITSLLGSYMLSRMPTYKATIFNNLSTAISLVAGALILSEPLPWYYILCCALIVAGVIGISLSGRDSTAIQK
jgi:drug/metabolite transporter (DMT)-like permease